jgi:hypothetical protein
MATQPFSSVFSLAPYKLAQMINPSYWLNSGTDQIGLINISGAASSKPEVEADIIENVATYGRQLGRMTDLLKVMLKHQHADAWRDTDKEAVDAFESMTAKIAAVKSRYLAPTQENVDKLIGGINSLRDTDHEEYERLKADVKRKLFDGGEKPARRRSSKS